MASEQVQGDPVPPSDRDPRRRRAALAAGAAVLVAGAVTAGLVLRSGDDDPAPSTPQAGGTSAATPSATTRAVPVLRVTPGGAGRRDGSSWADAGDLDDLPDLVDELTDGGEVWLRADAGAYELDGEISLRSGGVEGQPVVVRGVDQAGQPQPARLVSDRVSPYRPDGDKGGEAFEMTAGADHLAFRDLAFEDVGSAFSVSGDVTDLAITDTTARNVRRFLDNTKDDDQESATISGLLVRDVSVTGFSKGVVRLRYDTHDVLVEDVVGDSQQQDRDDFAMGVHLDGTVHDVVLRRVRMDNARDTLRKYWNGDGFSTEEEVRDVTFEQTSASGNTDAGYDLKSSGTRLVDAVAKDNKRNFRLWSEDVVAERCRGSAPAKRGGSGAAAQVWMSEGATATLTDCTLEDSRGLVFELGDGAELTMRGGRITRAADGALERTEGDAELRLSDVAQP